MSEFNLYQFDDLVELALNEGAVPIKGNYQELTQEDAELLLQGAPFDDFIVYIRDHAYESGFEYKFHICRCQTIDTFIERGLYSGKYYKLYIKNVDVEKLSQKKFKYKVPVYWDDLHKKGEESMKVCRHCLRALNYKGYANATENQRNQIVERFDLQEFYEMYGTLIPLLDGVPEGDYNEYSKNWKNISRIIRSNAKWKCENCKRDCSQHHDWLHVHHVDHDKRNNRTGNLEVLCKWCHEDRHKKPHLRKTL